LAKCPDRRRESVEPAGAENDACITVDAERAARVAGGICATLPERARFGEMMRNHGISNGRQMVPGP